MLQKLLLLSSLVAFSLFNGQAQNTDLSPEFVIQLDKWRENLSDYQKWKDQITELKKELADRLAYKSTLLNAFDSLADLAEQQSPKLDSLGRIKRFLEKKYKPYQDKVVFKVQIAVYRQHPIDDWLNKNGFVQIDQTEKEQKKYLLGNFRAYQEAKKFSNWLNKAGASTYVVGYKNNRRLNSISTYAD
jgi:hypothetical protein